MTNRPRVLSLMVASALIAMACSSSSSSPTVAPSGSTVPSSSPSASASPNSAATMTDTSLAVSVLAEGLDQPTAMAFIGDDAALVTEKATGRVMRIQGVFHPSGDPASRAYEDNSQVLSAS